MRLVTFFHRVVLGLLPSLLAACTATNTATEAVAPASRPTATPTSVGSDADRRAIYEANAPAAPAGNRRPAAVPDATPNTLRLGEQAADINRRKHPESLNTNDPNLSAPETRLQRLGQSPTDTVRRVP